MSDLDLLERRLDALGIAPVNDRQRRLAVMTVCEVMTRSGDSNEQIKDVLAALGLTTVSARRGAKPRRAARNPRLATV